MKRTILLTIALFMLGFEVKAQQAEEIKNIVVANKDSAYYDAQVKAWGQKVKENSKDENAWRNYFKASNYLKYFCNGEKVDMDGLFEQMKESIPDTYTYNMCAYYSMVGEEKAYDYAEKALQMKPDGGKDIDLWTGYLMIRNDSRLPAMAKRYYESGEYSPAVLQYNFNELQGMEDGGIYVGNGDVCLIPKALLQYAMGLHKDKIVIAASFLYLKPYRDALFKKLGIGEAPEPKDIHTKKDADDYCDLLFRTIRDRSHRPMYFPAFNWQEMVPTWKKNLYNEGLTVRYSAKPYNNLAVKKRNVEERYMMEYLHEKFYPDTWGSSSRLSVNYAVLLSDLLPIYKKQNMKRYTWLQNLLTDAVNGTSLDSSSKVEYLKMVR